MQRRPLAKNGVQALGIRARDPAHIQMAKPSLELVRAAERLLHLDLLVEHHPDEQGKRVSLQQLVRGRVLRPDDGHGENSSRIPGNRRGRVTPPNALPARESAYGAATLGG